MTAAVPKILKITANAHCSSELDCPDVAILAINEALARRIIRLANTITANRLYDLRDSTSAALWYKTDPEDAGATTTPMQTEHERLVVTGTSYSFTCYLRHSNDLIDCDSQKVEDLAAFFDLPWSDPIRRSQSDRPWGADTAEQFWSELLDSVESLSGIVDTHGAPTLVDLVYLHQAILTGDFIDDFKGDSRVREFAAGLPSGSQWTAFISRSIEQPDQA